MGNTGLPKARPRLYDSAMRLRPRPSKRPLGWQGIGTRGGWRHRIAALSFLMLWANVCLAQTTIVVRILDGHSGFPIPNSVVRLFERRLEATADGVARLSPLQESRQLDTQTADMAGYVRFLTTTDSILFQTDSEADGYFGATLSMVLVHPGENRLLEIKLTPHQLSTESVDESQFDIFIATGLPSTGVPVSGPVHASASFARSSPAPLTSQHVNLPIALPTSFPVVDVPPFVLVTNLQGSGFTGMIQLDELIAGTVTAEMNDGFPLEALKAQAVAARTFALDRLARRGYANGGQAYEPVLGSRSLNATLNTRRIVLLANHQLFPAYYSARCPGDFTLNSEDGPTLANCRLGGLGAGRVSWARSRSCSGHVSCLDTAEVCCRVIIHERTNHVYGHGVGLCQRGAQQFAGSQGWPWQQLLLHYYTDISIANLPALDSGSAAITTASRLNLRTAPCGSTLATVPANTPAIILSGPERPICTALANPYQYLTWWEVWLPGSGQRGWVSEDYLRAASEILALPLDLACQAVGDRIVVSWTIQGPEMILQETFKLDWPTVWSEARASPTAIGNRRQVDLPRQKENRYFRLSTSSGR